MSVCSVGTPVDVRSVGTNIVSDISVLPVGTCWVVHSVGTHCVVRAVGTTRSFHGYLLRPVRSVGTTYCSVKRGVTLVIGEGGI